MKLMIERKYAEQLIASFPDLHIVQEQLRFSERAEISIQQLSSDALDYLGKLYEEGGSAARDRAIRLKSLRDALADEGERFEEGELESVVPAIARYLARGAIRGWLFEILMSKHALPYVITRLDYTPQSNEEISKVFIEIKANAKGTINTQTIRLYASDVVGKTVAEIFASRSNNTIKSPLAIMSGEAASANNSRGAELAFTLKTRMPHGATPTGHAKISSYSPAAAGAHAWSMTKAS
jgi:hypothetical protein